MLFVATYAPRAPSEEGDKRSLQLFTSWEPPIEFTAHWARADGDGGIAVFEAESAAQVLEGLAPWAPWLEFDVIPVVPIEDAVPILMGIDAWRDSVS